MTFQKLITISLILTINIMSAEDVEVNKLLEKVNHAPNSKVKKELIEELKEKLAKKNKKAREEADAIIKAKKKIPLKIYKQNLIVK